MYHQLLDIQSCLPCLLQDTKCTISAYYFGKRHHFLSITCSLRICGYYVNEIFLFKNDKYEKYFANFEKEKRYLLYYGIYVVSLVVQLATFYLLLMEIVK